MSPIPTPNEHNGASDGLLFITGLSPEDFKSRQNMTRVRKKAMGSYLKEKKPRGPAKEQLNIPREDLGESRWSVDGGPQYGLSNGGTTLSKNGGSSQAPSQSNSFQIDLGSQRRMTPPAQASRLPRISMDFVLPSAPIVIPPREGVTLPYDEFSPGPFQSLGKPLDPFQAMFQSSHPKVSVEELKFYCSRSFGTKAMGMHWIPTVVKLPHTFLSTLCLASAHYDAVYERPIESVQTLALRQEVMHLISQNLLNPESRGDDYNIVALTQLIASEIIAAEEMTLDFHETGIEAMIRQRGGLEHLGMNGRLASAISWISLESAILREARPRTIYFDHCASTCTKTYPNTATIPESPLYCPRSEFETIKRSSRCTSRAIDLLRDIRMMMDLFLHETKQSRHNSLSLKNMDRKITSQYPPASDVQRGSVITANDWKYEAIRMTGMLTATSITQRIPLSDALKQVAEIQKTKGSNCVPNAKSCDETFISPVMLGQESPLVAVANPFAFTPIHLGRRASSTASLRAPSDNSTTFLTQLKATLESSDLSDCWADMAGVLLWVALTAGAASHKSDKKALKKWFKALAMRVSIILCFEHPEAIHASLLRMGDVIEGVKGRNEAMGERGKRRK
jgi:hypothetical protein